MEMARDEPEEEEQAGEKSGEDDKLQERAAGDELKQKVEGDKIEEGKSDRKISTPSVFSERSSVFSIDEYEDPKKGEHHRRKKHHLHLFRLGHHRLGQDHRHRRHSHAAVEVDLKSSNSHDGCEGLPSGGSYADWSIASDKGSITMTQSEDCLDSAPSPTSAGDRGGVPMGRSVDCLDAVLSPAAIAPAAAKHSEERAPRTAPTEGKQHKRTRSRTLSWSHAKAAAHHVTHDVSHFFHRSPKHHHEHHFFDRAGGRGAAHHREIEVALGEEKKDSDHVEKKPAQREWDLEKGAGGFVKTAPQNKAKKIPDDAIEKVMEDVLDKDRTPNKLPEKTRAHQKQSKRVSYDETVISESISENSEHLPRKPARRPISRNFSFVAWRDSEAGEEGNDAISMEELERYNIDTYLSQTLSLSRTLSLDAIDDEKAESEKDEKKEDEQSKENAAPGNDDASDPSTEASKEAKKKSTVNTKAAGREGRRVVLKSTPKEGLPSEPNKETVGSDRNHAAEALKDPVGTVTNAAYYGGYKAKEHATEAVKDPVGTVTNAAYYGGYKAKELVDYYGGFHQDKPHQDKTHQDKTFIAEHATAPDGHARYAIKIISPEIVENDFKKFLQAAMDMATETYFLSVLNHPNILQLRAVGQGDMFSPDYFLVLDRLSGTLGDRIEGPWAHRYDHLENGILVWHRAKKQRALWEERMAAMRDLAGALRHLHDLKIIYRDIKPENVGFDSHGNVKLFDFGLAKELRVEDECANGTYKLTPSTGSVRYMAPENGNRWPYSFSADSYSIGILLWEVASLERPFANYAPREMRDLVMRWGERPKVPTGSGWGERVEDLMKRAWDANFRKRPSMKEIEETLEKELEDSTV